MRILNRKVPLPELERGNLNFCVVDIESASLSTHRYVVCVGIKPLNGEPYVIGFDNTKRVKHSHLIDAEIVRETKRHLEHFDGWVYWNGDHFDKPFINDRLSMTNQEILERRWQLDLMKSFKWPKSRTAGISLKFVSGQFGSPFEKVDMTVIEHEQARNQVLVYSATGKWHLEREQYDKLVAHCIEDLRLTQWMLGPAKPRTLTIRKS